MARGAQKSVQQGAVAGGEAFCRKYNGPITNDIVTGGVLAGELEPAAGGMSTGVCRTELGGQACKNTIVVEPGSPPPKFLRCPLSNLIEGAPLQAAPADLPATQ